MYISFLSITSVYEKHNFFNEFREAMSSSDAEVIALVNNISFQINRYFGIFTCVFGVIGNILNILILSQKPLRSNPCTWLFLNSSIASLISVLFGVIPRFLSTWDADLTNTNDFLCKFRVFTVFGSLTIGFWLIGLATIDRWLSSNVDANRRRMSTLKNAQRSAVLIVILSILLQIQQVFCFDANVPNTPLKCYSRTATCGMISDLCFALITILSPLLIIFIFGLMIILNLRKAQTRIQPMVMITGGQVAPNATVNSTERQNQQKKLDRHLLVMLFFQGLALIIFTIPIVMSKLYTAMTRGILKSAVQNTTEGFIFSLCLLFLYFASGMPFYIYTLTGGRIFQRALFNLMDIFIQKLMCRHN
jgi:hypothetical protein